MARFLGSFESAKNWNECYPLGNGRIGVMDDANPTKDTISLNDSTFWSGTGELTKPQYNKDVIAEVRKLYDKGKISEAERLIENEISGDTTESYIQLGSIITDKGKGGISNYYRKLEFATGLHTVTYKKRNTLFEEKSFVSFPNQVYIRQISCDKPSNLNIELTSKVKHETKIEGDMLLMEGLAPSTVDHPSKLSVSPVKYFDDKKGMSFTAICKVLTDGEIFEKAGKLFIKGYTKTEFYYTSKTSYEFLGDRYKYCLDTINTALEFGFEQSQNVSAGDFSRLFNRVKLSINGIEDSPKDIKKELINIKKGADPLKAVLTLYDFGRYLMIAGSREGSAALNLQGIWCNTLTPPWASNYTLNINFQMNYWAALSSNLIECYSPYVNQIKKIAENGKALAKSFGVRGWVAGHNSDLHGHVVPVDKGKRGSIGYSLCMGASGWLALSLYKRYQYTKDKKFLSKVFDVIKGAVEFYIDFITFDEKTNRYVCYPEISPENTYVLKRKRYSLDKAPAMTMCIIRELFVAYVDICNELKIEDDFKKEVARHIHFITPYMVSESGRIQEWSKDFEEAEPKHRHVSHLYGLYPGDEIAKSKGTMLKDAARKSLEARGDDGTGWALAWKTALWARLKDGNHAYELLKNSLRLKSSKGKMMLGGGGVYASLLSAHPPFQIDGNFGIVAAINEMLVQSFDELELLPALPDEWYEGEVKGLTIEGGKSISFYWKAGRVIRQTENKIAKPQRYSEVDFL